MAREFKSRPRDPEAGKRSRLQVDERRQQLLKLGMELFAQRAHDEIPIDEIARAAGISKGLLYHYFPSKRDFYVESVRHAASELVARIVAAESEGDPHPYAQLRRGLDSYLDYVTTHAGPYATLIRGAGVDPVVAEIVENTRRAFTGRILSGLQLSSPSALLETALRGWIGFVESASLEWVEHSGGSKGAVKREELRELLIVVLAGAMGAVGVTLPKDELD